SGVGASIFAGHGNLANLLHFTGDYEGAIHHIRLALQKAPEGSDYHIGALDTFARIRLAQGSLDDAEELLRTIDRLSAGNLRPASYANRHAILTHILASTARRQLNQARAHAESALALGDAVGDVLVSSFAALAISELRTWEGR